MRSLALSACVCAGTLLTALTAAAADPYAGIPPGFDFPADEATLERFRSTENMQEMREHAWYLWAGINQPAASSGPVWETWYRPAETFRLGAVPQGDRSIERAFEVPNQIEKALRGPIPQSVGQSLLSSVLFNEEAHQHIRSEKLYLQSTFDALNKDFNNQGTPTAQRDIPDFPAEAVVLKLVWWPISQTGMTAMPIWDFDPALPSAAGNAPETWKRFIAVDPTRTEVPAGETADLFFLGQAKKGCRVIPLSSFYHFELETDEQVEAGRDALGQIATGEDPEGQALQKGDFAALVCVHATTKEIDDWVWATYWWHDQPNEGPFAANRVDVVEGVWRNYLMDVALDMNTPREYDGTENACMNPWLEARFPNGLASNCMTCHQRATWPPKSFLPVTRGSLPRDDAFFEDAARLDFLWSVGFRAQPEPEPENDGQ